MPFNDILKDNMLDSVSKIKDGVDRSGLDFLRAGPSDTTMDLNVTPSSLTYSNAETSYSGTDCLVAIVYNEHVVVLGNVETASYSIHRDKAPVRTLGRTYAKNYTRGQRTIAGSLIFVQFDEAPLYKLYEFFNKKLENEHRFHSPLSDELPPFDIMLIFNNEYGYGSIIRLYGVEIVDEGGTFSINDIYSENVMQFIAKDIDPMVSNGSKGSFQRLLFDKMTQGKLIDEHYNAMLKYRQRLEQDLGNLQAQLGGLAKTSRQREYKDDWKAGDRRNAQAISRNQDRKVSQEKFALINRKIDSLIAEIQRMNANINNYEKTKMTWDLNSAVKEDYTSSAVFHASTAPAPTT